MQRGLVGAQFHDNILFRQPLPQIHHIPLVSDRHHLFPRFRLAHALHQRVQIIDNLVHPTLRMTGMRGFRVDFRRDAHTSGNISGFRLGA